MAPITRFKQNALSFLDRPPSNEWEWLLLMQHHSLPTRLLNWTENPLVALYFVVKESLRRRAASGALIPSPLTGRRTRNLSPRPTSPVLVLTRSLTATFRNPS